MSSSSELGLTENEIIYQLASILHSGILDILAYGIYTAIFFVALYLTLSRQTDRPRAGSAVLITVMWVLVTIHASITWAKLDDTYIQHGETRETQLSSLPLFRVEHLAVVVIDAVVILISLLLADMTMIWRCWVLYGHRWQVVAIPSLSIVAGSVSYIWRTVLKYTTDGVRTTNRVTNLELSFLSTTVITNIFCTTAIIYRIIVLSGWKTSLKTYSTLTEILIESSILYTAVNVIRMGLEIHAQHFTEVLDERFFYAQALGYSITGIAPTLVIARVAAGFARPHDSTRASLPHMGSAIRSLAESLHFAQPATGTATASLHVERSIRLEEDTERPDTSKDDSRSKSLPDDEKEKTKGQVSFQEV